MGEENNMDPEKYMQGRVMSYIKGIEKIAESGSNEDSTRLKAHSTLLNKMMPDRTKTEVDLKNMSPYEMFMREKDDGK